MAYPFLIDETFDDGTRGSFDSEVDTGSVLDFPTYKELARSGLSPWRGAHALRVRLSGVNNAYIEEASAANVDNISLWFPLCIGADVTLDDGDTINILEFRSVSGAEAVVGLRRSGADYQLFAGDNLAQRILTITRSNSKWHQVELTVARVNGTLDFYIDGAQVGSQLTGLTMNPFNGLRLGVPSGTSTNDAGNILVGGIIADDVRIFPRHRFGRDTVWVTKDQTVFVGDGELDSVELTGTATDAVITILDTDIFESTLTNFSREPIVYLRNVVANDQTPGLNLPVQFHKGLYIQLTGTNPQAWVSIGNGSIVQSHSNYIDHARK